MVRVRADHATQGDRYDINQGMQFRPLDSWVWDRSKMLAYRDYLTLTLLFKIRCVCPGLMIKTIDNAHDRCYTSKDPTPQPVTYYPSLR